MYTYFQNRKRYIMRFHLRVRQPEVCFCPHNDGRFSDMTEFPLLEKYGLQDIAFTCANCSYCQVGHGACPTFKTPKLKTAVCSVMPKTVQMMLKTIALNKGKSPSNYPG